jgi:hypothetical protein
MKQLFISEMIMNACRVDPIHFSHRRAWILLDIFAFWWNIGTLIILLAFRLRLCGGGIELEKSFGNVFSYCCRKCKKENESGFMKPVDEDGEVLTDAGAM